MKNSFWSVLAPLSLLVLTFASGALSGLTYSTLVPVSNIETAQTSGTVDVKTLLPAVLSASPPQVPAGPRQQSLGVGPSVYPRTGPVMYVPKVANAPLFNTSSSSVATSSGFDGLVEFQSCPCVPPDVQVAAGPNHLVEMINFAGEILTKQGLVLQAFNLSAFFKTGPNSLSDPKVLYDASSARWFASIINSANKFATGNVTFAVSATGDPTGIWTIYHVSPGANLPDQPIIGISDDKFVISANDFPSTGSYSGAQYWVVNKNDLLAGSASPRLVSFGPFPSLESVHPVQSLSSTTTQYLVTVGAGELGPNSTMLRLISVTGLPGVLAVTNSSVVFQVPLMSTAPSAAEPSNQFGPFVIDTGDYRVLDAVWSQGKLWLGLDDACQGVSCIRLVQIDTTSSSLKQDFDFSAPGIYYFYPALRIDGSGNLDMIYGFSNSSTYASIAVTGQAVADPAGSLAPSVKIKSGSGTEVNFRYGDYYGAALDPNDTSIVWVAGEYNSNALQTCDIFAHAGSRCWATFIDNVAFSGFSLTASTASQSFTSGSSANATINSTSINGFTGTVSLATTTSPQNGLSVSCSLSSLTLGSSATSTCTFASSTPGSYSVTVIGTSGPRFRSLSLTVNVVGFGISFSPAVEFVSQGSSSLFTVIISSINGFSGTVGLTTTVSPSVTNGPTASLSQTSLTIIAFGSGKSNLTITTSSQTPSGLFTANVTGTSGLQSHNAFLPFGVPTVSVNASNSTTFTGVTVNTSVAFTVLGFSLSGSPSKLAVAPGSSITSTITVSSQNGFTGTIALTSTLSPITRRPPTVSLNSASITLASFGSGTSMMTFATSSKTTTGPYSVNITATSGSESRSIVISVNVTGTPGASCCVATATTGSFAPPLSLALSGSASVVATNATSKKHETLFSMTYPLTSLTFTISSPGTYQAVFLLNIAVNPYALSSDISITISGPAKTVAIQVTRNVDVDANSLVDVADVNTVQASIPCHIGQNCYNPKADLDADGDVGADELATVQAFLGARDLRPNFTMRSSITSTSIPWSGQVSISITFTSTYSFSGTITVSTIVYRNGLVAPYSGLTITPSSKTVVLTPGGNSTITVSIGSAVTATDLVVVTASSGSLANSVGISVHVGQCARFCPIP